MAQRLSDEQLKAFARYWYRAELMHSYVHAVMQQYEPDLKEFPKEQWWELETYILYWLAALFVLVEGFGKLKMKDAHVQRLFNEHVGVLKLLRHETYHFSIAAQSFGKMISQLNWAEELHDSIGSYIKTIIVRRAHVQRIVELRTNQKMPTE